MKLAIFGGTFNPVHIAHLALADDVCRQFGYDRILFTPAFIPPHKIMADTVDVRHRIAMLEAAFAGDERFVVNTCEIERAGTSYTVDTVKFIIEKYADVLEGKPALIMGQENAAEFEKWKDYRTIAALCDIIVARRTASSYKDNTAHKNENYGSYTGGFETSDWKKHLCELGIDFIELANPVLPVSSTEIRSRAANSQGFKYLVPTGVFEYIVKEKLYGYHD
ncbi:MAG: nicotinate (nicotinamide) nucleotide adenylyltransferase [Treponema sp.]|nr:nicotinate (nicotinamide) nucleotide adenylyltransferase [Treponema sp.]